MNNRFLVPLVAAGLFASVPAFCDSQDMLIEIYRVVPGKHEEFLRHIALLDQANVEAGIPPRQLFVHQDGASWDFVLLQPAHNTDEQNRSWVRLTRGSEFRAGRSSSSISGR